MSRNTTTTEFVFDIADVRKDVNEERGLGIYAYDDVEKRLQEIEDQGLIKIFPERGQFHLTVDGILYCKQLPETVG